MKGKSVRSVINRVLWDHSMSPEDFKAVYADRFEGSCKEFSLADVERIEGSFIILKSGTLIPLHRIRKIYDAKTGETMISR